MNPILELNKVQEKYCPSLFSMFGKVTDPRHQSYITYGMKEALGTLYYKYLAGLVSMRSMTEWFENEATTRNIYSFVGVPSREFLPHHQTLNELLVRVDPEEIERIMQKIVYRLIRRKSFDEAKYRKRWSVLVDATETYSGKRCVNDRCLQRRHKNENGEETINYYSSVLEAKIYLGNDIVASIASEFIENHGEDFERQKQMSAEAIKQDCETKAFKRLASKLKEAFPHLPICIQGDSLYASEPVMDICKENHWDYILRYKGGSIPSIEEEYELIPEKCKAGNAEYVNDIGYKKHEVNVLRYSDTKRSGEGVQFQFLTNIPVTKRNAEKLAQIGRNRWKIENQGFKRQKQEVGDITHLCSWNDRAMKNHYLMQQIADLFRRLYEVEYLMKHEIVKTQRKVSSDFLHSLSQPAETEDTFPPNKAKQTALC